MRMVAWLAGLAIFWSGCTLFRSGRPLTDDERALHRLGEEFYAAFASGNYAELQRLSIWGVPTADLNASMTEVFLADARASLAKLQSLPPAQRAADYNRTVAQMQAFLGAPQKDLQPLLANTHRVAAFTRQTHRQLFLRHSLVARDWSAVEGPSVLVRQGVDTQTALPEAAVEILFSLHGRSYKLQLNTCVRLPGHGWRVAEDVAWIDLTSQAVAHAAWTEDFAAAQVRARDENKTMLVDFTGSDWSPPCVALEQHVFNSAPFQQYARDQHVLVKVDFPRNRLQPLPLREANALLARAYSIGGYPTVLVLNANGTELKRINGYQNQTPAQYIQLLKAPPTPPDLPKPTKP